MSAFRTGRSAHHFKTHTVSHSPRSEEVSFFPIHDSHFQPHNQASKERQTMASEQRAGQETRIRLVPTLVEPPPQPQLHPPRLVSTTAEPLMVRLDHPATPRAVSAERMLHRMDQELQRIAGEMNRMSRQPPMPRPLDPPQGWTLPWPCGDLDLARPWSHSALGRDMELQRLWNPSLLYRNAGLVPPIDVEIPREVGRLNSGPLPAVLGAEAPWGAEAHAESWRKKENFHIDNPVVKRADGHSQFCLQFDLRQFKPGEVEIRVEDGGLTVAAKHEEVGDDQKQVRREYFRQCTIPNDVDPKSIMSTLSHSGILTVHAPLKPQPGITVETVNIPLMPAGAEDATASYDIRPV